MYKLDRIKAELHEKPEVYARIGKIAGQYVTDVAVAYTHGRTPVEEQNAMRKALEDEGVDTKEIPTDSLDELMLSISHELFVGKKQE